MLQLGLATDHQVAEEMHRHFAANHRRNAQQFAARTGEPIDSLADDRLNTVGDGGT